MIAVIFEVRPSEGCRDAYLDRAAALRPLLNEVEGFRSVERFESLAEPGKLLSLSFFDDEDALHRWRTLPPHRAAQSIGRAELFADYRLRIADIKRDYGLTSRSEAPNDSRSFHTRLGDAR